MRLPIALMSYSHRSLPVSAQRAINVMLEVEPETAKARAVLLPTPGLIPFADVGEATIRGCHVMGSEFYCVFGNGVYAVTVGGSVRSLGVIAGGGKVSMDEDGERLCIVVPESGQAYVVERGTGAMTEITGADWLGAISVTVMNAVFIFARRDSDEFFWSAIGDPTTFNPLSFATAEGAPDNLVAVQRIGGDLWLFGEETIEIWGSTSVVDNPFQRIPGGFISRGCAAAGSIVPNAGTAVWLGDDRVVYAATAAQPQRISTHAVEQAIGGYRIVSDAFAWTYRQDGHAFYVLSFPEAGDTWVYDFTAGMWHERESEHVGIWRALCGSPFAGGVIAGDAVTGQLWRVDPTAMLEGAEQVIRVVTGTSFHAEGKKTWITRLAAEFECGVGLGAGQGSVPQAWLAWSDDGGRTWSNDAYVGLGRQGVYRARAEWRRLGAARDRVFRVQWADPVLTSLIAVNVDAEAGDS